MSADLEMVFVELKTNKKENFKNQQQYATIDRTLE